MFYGFGGLPPERRYVLRTNWATATSLPRHRLSPNRTTVTTCGAVAPRSARVDVRNLGSGWALHAETDDLYLDDHGAIARISGVDYRSTFQSYFVVGSQRDRTALATISTRIPGTTSAFTATLERFG